MMAASTEPTPSDPLEPDLDFMRLCDIADAILGVGTIESKAAFIRLMPTMGEAHDATAFLKRMGLLREVRH